jgi:hypothetical protein
MIMYRLKKLRTFKPYIMCLYVGQFEYGCAPSEIHKFFKIKYTKYGCGGGGGGGGGGGLQGMHTP